MKKGTQKPVRKRRCLNCNGPLYGSGSQCDDCREIKHLIKEILRDKGHQEPRATRIQVDR